MVLVNGIEDRTIDVSDRGFLYGDGVFETILVENGGALLLSEHLARLILGCEKLGIAAPDKAILVHEIEAVIGSTRQGVLKIIITRGQGGRGYQPPDRPSATRVVNLHPVPAYPESFQQRGVKVRICRTRLGINPALAGIKHLNRLEQILARSEWSDESIQEGLMMDQSGCIVEGTKSNLFLVSNGVVRTPRVDQSGVAGIIRAMVMASMDALGLPLEETRLKVDDVRNADELFLTNSVMILWPIKQLENKSYEIGRTTRRIQNWIMDKIAMEST